MVGAIHDPGLAVNLPCQLYIAEKFMFWSRKKKKRETCICAAAVLSLPLHLAFYPKARIFHDVLQ